jgi:hypothetical protein
MAGGDADAAAKWIEHGLAEDIDGTAGLVIGHQQQHPHTGSR